MPESHGLRDREDGRATYRLPRRLVMILLGVLIVRQSVRELYQLRGRRLHGKRILLGIKILERNRIADKYLRKLARQASRGRDGLCLDALADLELEATCAILGALGDIDGDSLSVFWVPGFESLAHRRGRHGSRCC